MKNNQTNENTSQTKYIVCNSGMEKKLEKKDQPLFTIEWKILTIDVVSKASIFVYRLHRDWCDILSRSTIDIVLS